MNFPTGRVARILISVVVVAASLSLTGCTRARRGERISVTNNLPASDAININTATAAELEQLPNIGETLARRIIEFRETNGPFRRAETLLLVDGLSEKKLRAIRPLIKTD